MAGFILNRYELSQYSRLRSQVVELNENIREIEDELAELNKYNVNISPVCTGMPSGNERHDKIAEFVIRLENDRRKLNETRDFLLAEREAIRYRLHKIRIAVSKIPDKLQQEVIKLHYIEGNSVEEVAKKAYITTNAAYKRINKFFKQAVKQNIKAR